MLRLDLTSEPRWLDLGHGVRLLVAPLTTALMVAARTDPILEALPATASDETRALLFAKAIARIAVTDWEGVGDADGNPVPVTPAGIDALLEVWPLFEVFQASYVAGGLLTASASRSPRPARSPPRSTATSISSGCAPPRRRRLPPAGPRPSSRRRSTPSRPRSRASPTRSPPTRSSPTPRSAPSRRTSPPTT